MFAGGSGIEDRRDFRAAQRAVVNRRFVDAAVEEIARYAVFRITPEEQWLGVVINGSGRGSTGDLDAVDVDDLLFRAIIERVSQMIPALGHRGEGGTNKF